MDLEHDLGRITDGRPAAFHVKHYNLPVNSPAAAADARFRFDDNGFVVL